MNNRHRKTLKAVFTNPTPSDLKWQDLESLLINLGGVVKEGRGSRLRVSLNGVKAVFHEPHPTGKEVCQCTIREFKMFLENAGISPS